MTTAILIKSACSFSPTGVVLNALENFMIFVCFFSKFNASGKFFSCSMFDPLDTWALCHLKSSQHCSIVPDELSANRKAFGFLIFYSHFH